MDKGIIDRIDDLNLAVLAYNNESVIKEAYYTYFTISNRCELNSHLKRIENFLRRYNISYDTFLDYVKAYGLLFLNISIETLKHRITAISSLSKDQSKAKNDKLFTIVSEIKSSNNDEQIEKLVLSNRIYLDKIDYLFTKGYLDRQSYDLITFKVRNAIESLSKKYFFLHFSTGFSIIEKEDNEEIIEIIIRNNNLHKCDIRSFISTYRNNLTDVEKENLEKSISEKLEEAKERIKIKDDKEKSKQLENILNGIDFTLFLDSNIKSVNDFCCLMGINRSDYYIYLELLKDLDNPLYLAIKEKSHNSRKNINSEYSKDNVVSIANQIKNGCFDKDGNTRKIELLDYFLQTKLSPGKFVDAYCKSEERNEDTLLAIRDFFNNNVISEFDNDCMLFITSELNGTTIFMLNDEPYEVTREEKEDVINFLQERGIPLYTKVYKQALKRHINGNLILEDEKRL